MKEDLAIKDGIVIPASELEMKTSRAGGPGGQHVNKADTRVTIRWNVLETTALTDEQKQHVFKRLGSAVTDEGDVIVHSSASRSQLQNKKAARDVLAEKISKALYIPKRRMKTRVPKAVKRKRIDEKKRRSVVKKMRGKVTHDE